MGFFSARQGEIDHQATSPYITPTCGKTWPVLGGMAARYGVT